MFGDLTYHNYALDISEIKKLWSRGFNDVGCSTTPVMNINNQINPLGNGINNFF
jgi:hypothetical protein